MSEPRLTPPIVLTLDRERTLWLDLRAIFQAERDLCRLWGAPKNILTVLANSDGLTLNDLAVLLHRGLLEDDPGLTLEETQDLMTFDKLPAITTAIFAAWNAATMPAVPDTEEDRQNGPLQFPGVPSGATDVLS